MTELTDSLVRTMKEFEKLPGIGKKSSERIVYHLLGVSSEEAFQLADAIRAMKENVRYCKNCFNLAEDDLCNICRDPLRDMTTLCVVEQPRDLIALEKTGRYRGLYHVLLGRLSPLDGVSSEQLTIEALIKRVKRGSFKELIMATNPTTEGDGTALTIMDCLKGTPLKITRLARGVTTGSALEFANNEMLADAISRRQSFDTSEN
ncbi:MAG: recombination mediator RecR [Thermoguttaceae bacterium]